MQLAAESKCAFDGASVSSAVSGCETMCEHKTLYAAVAARLARHAGLRFDGRVITRLESLGAHDREDHTG
jgi:hypothetical protein